MTSEELRKKWCSYLFIKPNTSDEELYLREIDLRWYKAKQKLSPLLCKLGIKHQYKAVYDMRTTKWTYVRTECRHCGSVKC